MNDELVLNRIALTGLIYAQPGEFTEDDLKNAYHAGMPAGKPLAIDGGQTLRDYLKDLAQLGVLESEFGTYRVAYSSAR